MAVRSKQLAIATVNGGASLNPAYTCPAGETALLKYLTVYPLAGITSYEVAVRPGGTGGSFYGIVSANASANVAVRYELWVVLHPADVVTFVASGASGSVRFLLSGAELEGVAD